MAVTERPRQREELDLEAEQEVDFRRYWNAVARDWVLDASTFDVWVGGDSAAELGTTFEVA